MEQVIAGTTQATFTTYPHHSPFKMHHDHFSASSIQKKKQQQIYPERAKKLT